MLKKYIGYYKRHKGLFALDMSSSFIIAVFELTLPLLIQMFIDSAVDKKDSKAMITISVIFVIMLIGTAVFNYIVTYYGHVMGTKIERDMREDLFAHFQTMDSSFFAKEKVGRLMSRLVSDLRDISEFAHHGPEDIFLSIITILGSFAILLYINVSLSLILIAILIVMIIATFYRRKKMQDAFRSTREVHAELNSQIENSLSGINVMKSYTNEEYEMNRFKDANSSYQESWNDAYWEMGVFTSTMQFMMKLMTIVVVIVGGYSAYKGNLTAGELFAFVLYISYFTRPIARLVGFFDMFNKGWSGFERFYRMLQITDDVKNGDVEFSGVKEKIEFKNITFKYEEETVFKNLSFTVEKGQSIALVGKTGVGKSTIAKLIPRFYDVTEGEILFDGVNVKEFTIPSLRSSVGYVEQDSYIFFGTIRENIMYGNINATDEEIMAAAKAASIDDFIYTLPNGYNTSVGDKGVKLSGGQKQRISLARMFLKNPEILVLDEATSALDNNTELAIQQSIAKLSKGRTSIIIAHRLTTVTDCDVIYVLDETGICESGSHNELMAKKSAYYKMYMSALKENEY